MDSLAERTFRVVEDLRTARSMQAVLSLIRGEAANYGLSKFIISGIPLPGEGLPEHVLLSGWPDEWLSRYAERGYVESDPVAAAIRRSTRPFRWKDISYDSQRNPKARRVMSEAGEFGMKAGYTVPILSYNGHQACVSLGGEAADMSGREENSLYLVCMVAYSAAKGLTEETGGDAREEIQLSERETEVLKWLSVGKTAWEISCILGISHKTVEKHTASIACKLNVANRTHAVAEAMRRNIIN